MSLYLFSHVSELIHYIIHHIAVACSNMHHRWVIHELNGVIGFSLQLMTFHTSCSSLVIMCNVRFTHVDRTQTQTCVSNYPSSSVTLKLSISKTGIFQNIWGEGLLWDWHTGTAAQVLFPLFPLSGSIKTHLLFKSSSSSLCPLYHSNKKIELQYYIM